MAHEVKEDTPIYFWKEDVKKYGPHAVFSQWYLTDFVGDVKVPYDLEKELGDHFKLLQGLTFKSREHWMMALKALLYAKGKFKAPNLQVFRKIIATKSPSNVKNMGRDVVGFTEDFWKEWRYKIVVNGNYLQFSQDDKLKKILLNTGNRIIVEASPYDRIYGIGYNAKDAVSNRDKWPGEDDRMNLLGKALMEVRETLQ